MLAVQQSVAKSRFRCLKSRLCDLKARSKLACELDSANLLEWAKYCHSSFRKTFVASPSVERQKRKIALPHHWSKSWDDSGFASSSTHPPLHSASPSTGVSLTSSKTAQLESSLTEADREHHSLRTDNLLQNEPLFTHCSP
jgi:hypothetical protein